MVRAGEGRLEAMESAAVNVADESAESREPESSRVPQKSQTSKGFQNSQESTPRSNGKRRFLLVLRFFAGAIVAFAIAYLSARYYLVSMVRQGLQPDTSWRIVVLRVAVLMPLPLIVCSWVTLGWHRVNDWLHKCRWALGGVVIAFCTVFKISGSSINAWHWYLQTGNLLNQTILGYPRLSRSDEYAIQTPFAASQAYNGHGQFNSLLGGIDSTDMMIIKDSPTYAVGEIFHPFHWGYLLFGTAHGLAFYWSARLVVLFLAGYEFFRIITRKVQKTPMVPEQASPRQPRCVLVVSPERRGLAALGAALVTFSSLLQWWFAVNDIAEMFIAIFGAVVLFDKYLTIHGFWKRFGFALLIAECAGMFLWSLYPAWMIPLAYVLAAVLIWQIVSHWGTVRMRWQDWMLAAVVLVIFLVLTVLVAKDSANTIVDELNTSYPGKRLVLGGSGVTITSMLGSAGAQFLYNFFIGVPEDGHIAGFFPLGFLLAIANMFGNRSKHRADVMTVILLFETVLFAAFIVVGLPSWLARVTLLSTCTTPRAAIGFELASLILLIRSVAVREWGMKAGSSLAIAVVIAAYGAHFSERYAASTLSPFVGKHAYVIPTIIFLEYLALSLMGLYSSHGEQTESSFIALNHRAALCLNRARAIGNRLCHVIVSAGAAFIVIVTVVTGMLINPVQRGTDSLSDEQVVLAAKAANAEKTGMFATLGEGGQGGWFSNVLAANGLTVVNSFQTTPHWNLWKVLDPQGEHLDAYNRCAYINFVLATGASDTEKFVVSDANNLVVSVTPSELHDLGVTYVTSEEDLSGRTFGGWGFEKISEDGAVDLWELVSQG